MNRTTAIVVAFGLVCLVTHPAQAQTATNIPALVSADWSVNAPHNLASNPPSLEAVEDFTGRAVGESEENPPVDVCEFRFADLRNSGNLSLIVSVDGGGKGGCNLLYTLTRHQEGSNLTLRTHVDMILRTASWISIATAGTSWFCGRIWHPSPQGQPSASSDVTRNRPLFSLGPAILIPT